MTPFRRPWRQLSLRMWSWAWPLYILFFIHCFLCSSMSSSGWSFTTGTRGSVTKLSFCFCACFGPLLGLCSFHFTSKTLSQQILSAPSSSGFSIASQSASSFLPWPWWIFTSHRWFSKRSQSIPQSYWNTGLICLSGDKYRSDCYTTLYLTSLLQLVHLIIFPNQESKFLWLWLVQRIRSGRSEMSAGRCRLHSVWSDPFHLGALAYFLGGVFLPCPKPYKRSSQCRNGPQPRLQSQILLLWQPSQIRQWWWPSMEYCTPGGTGQFLSRLLRLGPSEQQLHGLHRIPPTRSSAGHRPAKPYITSVNYSVLGHSTIKTNVLKNSA